jgi:VWFA-related protein
MKLRLLAVPLAFAALLPRPGLSQQSVDPQPATVRTTVDEVLLDLIVRDKKGKPVTDLKPADLTVIDNNTRQTLTSFRLVSGSEAITAGGGKTALDPLRQVRLVTLAFESMTEADQRKLARNAALDLVKGAQGTNVFYSVVVINTQLRVLQPFTTDKAALTKAIEYATGGLGGPGMASESDAILAQLKRNLGGATGAVQDADVRAAAGQVAGQTVSNGSQALDAKLASIMLDMLRMDAAASSQGSRLTLSGLRALVDGQQSMPGRKSVVYFTWGMYLTPELDAPFHALMSTANRNNVTFYSVDTRGVMVSAQTTTARSQLSGAARASMSTITQTSGAVTKDEIMSSDNAEVSARSNVQESIRTLAESTGGFLIGDSNDLRVPLRNVNEEISSYYELSYNPGIQNYDGSFRKLAVSANRKDLVIHARNGYFALPPEARAAGLMPYEMDLLKMLSDGARSDALKFRAGAILLQSSAQGRGVMVLVEVPLRELEARKDAAKPTLGVHFSLVALIKNGAGEVVERLSRDRSLAVTPEQSKMGNFLDRVTLNLPPGKYRIESVLADRQSGKSGTQLADFTLGPQTSGVGISSLVPMRAYTANVKGLDADDPFQYQGGSITPTLDFSVKRGANAALRLFFTVYRDAAITAQPSVEIDFLQAGKSLTRIPMELPAPDSQGRIAYPMTIPAASIPLGTYEIRAVAKQGNSTAEAVATVRIDP